jgi:Zn-dependent metalloprotease
MNRALPKQRHVRLLRLCPLTILSCLPSLALAATVPSISHPVKPQVGETSTNTSLVTQKPIASEFLEAKRASEPPSSLAVGKSGTDSKIIASQPEQKPAKLKSAISATNRRKQLDRLATKAVNNYLKNEGTQRFGIVAPEKEIRITQIRPDPNFPDRRILAIQQQTVQGIPIFGATSTIEFSPQQGLVEQSGIIVPGERFRNVGAVPTISWSEAIDRALESYRRSDWSRSSQLPNEGQCAVTVHLKVFDPAQLRLKTGSARLAWHVRVKGFVVFIDAETGSPIFHYNDIQSAFGGRRTYDVDYGLQDQCFESLVLSENGPEPSSPPVSPDPNDDAGKAHAAAKQAYEFFKQLGWDSYDNQGSFINSCVRAKDERNRYGQWDPDAKCMTFYPGLLSAQDIAGHEFTHGVIQYLPALIYHGESGALSEALADFFGSQIEGSKIESLNWSIGENVPMDSSETQPPSNALPLRDMANPHKGSSSLTPCNEMEAVPTPGFYPNCARFKWNRGQPDHYAELVNSVKHDICGFLPGGDNECIHLNSGIFNKAMYLAANGGDHHGVHVEGIKGQKLVRIMFRTLEKLGASSDLKTGAETSVKACTSLIGQFHIKQADCNQVKNAFVAVGLLSQ